MSLLNSKPHSRCRNKFCLRYGQRIEGTSSGRKTHLAFIEDDVKISKHVYLNMLKDEVIPRMFALIICIGMTLQQDGATTHTAKMAQAQWLKNFTAFWLKEMLPPSSTHLNFMDLGLCSIMEKKACRVSQTSVEVLKKKLTDSLYQIKSESVRASCAQVIQLLRCVIRKKRQTYRIICKTC